jgi:hypothetical protein
MMGLFLFFETLVVAPSTVNPYAISVLSKRFHAFRYTAVFS